MRLALIVLAAFLALYALLVVALLPLAGLAGYFYFAIGYPTRPALADALRRLASAGIRLSGASDPPAPVRRTLWWTG